MFRWSWTTFAVKLMFLGLPGALTWCKLVIYKKIEWKVQQKHVSYVRRIRTKYQEPRWSNFESIFGIQDQHFSAFKETAGNKPVSRLFSFPYNFHLKKLPEESNLQLVALRCTNDIRGRDEFQFLMLSDEINFGILRLSLEAFVMFFISKGTINKLSNSLSSKFLCFFFIDHTLKCSTNLLISIFHVQSNRRSSISWLFKGFKWNHGIHPHFVSSPMWLSSQVTTWGSCSVRWKSFT